MARPIVLSNGELHVGLNKHGLVHDFYFPYVGLENHVAGPAVHHKVGIWVDGQMSWIDDESTWSHEFHYPHMALIGHTVVKSDRLGVLLEFDDCVDSQMSAFMRNIHVVNLHDQPRDIRLFMHQAFVIGDSGSNTDTVQYLPDSDAVLHYRGRRAFVISGSSQNKPFDQYTVGLFGIEGHEGTYRDADDGELSGSNVEHGRVDSTLRFQLQIAGHSSARVYYWIAAGRSLREALYVHKQMQTDGLQKRLQSTAEWWHKWLQPAIDIARKLPVDHQNNFIESVMIIKSQIDKRGAVIASTDTTLLNYDRDAYAYCWPRDGAFAIWPLIRLGYQDEPYRFFEFCKRVLNVNGYLMHKYRADGSLGSSWHPYIQDDIIAPPIQVDETALVLFVFVQFYHIHPEPSLIKNFYVSLVTPMADFLASYIDETTKLPKPSYDLWEQVFWTTTYTTSVVYGALLAASDLAMAAHDEQSAVKWRTAAEDIQSAAHKRLYNPDRKVFYKGIIAKNGTVVTNDIIDASAVFGAFLFGLFPSSSDELKQSVDTLKERFAVNQGAIGIPRFENDNYRRVHSETTGNLWFITSLWLAQFYIDQGQSEKALEILDWVKNYSLPTGMISEQVDPVTEELISPAPLTWSHAEYISTLLDLISLKE